MMVLPHRSARNVKIIATLGPSCKDYDIIRNLHLAGADTFRLNMSHQSRENLRHFHTILRAVEQDVERPIGILVDLQGPKPRIGRLSGGEAVLTAGESFRLDLEETPGDNRRAPLPHEDIIATLSLGDLILLDDGRLKLRTTACDKRGVDTIIEEGGVLYDRKGINLPDTTSPAVPLTPKDNADIDEALSLGVDWIALSLVQHPEDVRSLQERVKNRAAIMAKIETPSALNTLDGIIDVADGIMIARGDLGVELPIEQVPGWQKQITRRCRRAGKPVVVATQMLESMITSPLPTRAEVSDVATAVFEGADSIMLSAESATGAHPVEAVRMMDSIAKSVETHTTYSGILNAQRAKPEPTGPDAISAAAYTIALTLNTAAILCYTTSGSTGLRVARERPPIPTLALTPNHHTARRLALVWGLRCILTEDPSSLDDMVARACAIAVQEGHATKGDKIIITAGVPLGTPGATNMLRVADIEGDE
ncbi:MAG: pyruvate kinase [Parvularculales bacterium]